MWLLLEQPQYGRQKLRGSHWAICWAEGRGCGGQGLMSISVKWPNDI